MKNKKLQIAVEMLSVYSLVLLMFTILLASISTQASIAISQQIYFQLLANAQDFASRIQRAYNYGNGYKESFYFPAEVGFIPFNLTITGPGIITASAKYGNKVLSAYAFSGVQSYYLDPYYAIPNGYSVPIAAGVINIVNSNGLICINSQTCPAYKIPKYVSIYTTNSTASTSNNVTIIAKVTDQFGNPIPYPWVGFSTTLGVFSNNKQTQFVQGDGMGIAKVTLKSNNQKGIAKVTATAFNGNTTTVSNLAAWFPLNENEQNIAFDVKNNNNGNAYNIGWLSATPISSASFNGVNAYIEQSNGFAFMNAGNANATISIWVYPLAASGVIVDELGQTSINTGWHDTWIELVNGNVYIRVWNLPCVNVGSIPLNKWSHIVLRLKYTGTSLNYSAYINGVYAGSGSGSRSVPGGSSLMYYPLGPTDGTNCGSGAWFKGMMANYQFYSTALTPQQIQQLYLQGINSPPIPNAGLVGWWPLQGNANDYSPYNNFGTPYNVIYNSTYPAPITGQTIVGNKIIFGSGKGAYAYYFNGSSAWNFSTGANTVTGPISSYKNKIFFQTTGGIYALYSNNGSLAWYASPSLTASSGDYPVIGGDKVYAIWGDNKIYIYNVTNGNIISSITVPIIGSGHTSLALANGNLYVGMGNNIYAFGSCKADPSDTVLNAIARFYANKQYFCANMLAYFAFSNSSQQMSYGLWVNDTFLPSISASFSQSPAGYIKATASSTIVSQLTVVFWIYPVNNGYWGNSGNYWENAVSGSGGCWNNYYFYIEAGSNPPKESWSITNSSGTQFRNFPGVSLTPNVWQQLVGVYNGSALLVYLNGKQIGSPVAAKGTVIFNGAMISGNNPISSGGGCNPISGNLANVQIYSTALTPQQIQQLYLQGINSPPLPNAGLVGWWPLNGDTNDYSGWFNTGFPFNGVTFNATSYPISFTTSSSSTAFGAGFNAYGSTNATRAFDIAIAGWSK